MLKRCTRCFLELHNLFCSASVEFAPTFFDCLTRDGFAVHVELHMDGTCASQSNMQSFLYMQKAAHFAQFTLAVHCSGGQPQCAEFSHLPDFLTFSAKHPSLVPSNLTSSASANAKTGEENWMAGSYLATAAGG